MREAFGCDGQHAEARLVHQGRLAAVPWPAGGGELGQLIRAFDWSGTSLGPSEAWPQSLRTATDLLLRSAIPIVMMWGEDGVVIYNDAYSVLAGGGHPRLLGRKVREGWPDLAATVMKVGLAGGALAFKDQELTLWRNGAAEQVWVNLDYSPVLDESGRAAGVIAILTETTARVRAERRHEAAEQTLHESEQTLRDLNADLERQVIERSRERGRTWQISPDILGVINADGFFESSNPAWASVLGWSETEVSRTPFLQFIHADDIERTQRAWEDAKQGQPALRFENRYRHKSGGYRWLSWVAIPEGGKIYCSARDVTAEKEQAAELAAAQDALRQSQKMEAVGQLTGGIAHDFNNMLAVVIGSLDLLGGRLGAADVSVRRYVDAATEGARRAASLTQRLLAFSRQQPLMPEPIDANALVAGMSDLLRRSLVRRRAAGDDPSSGRVAHPRRPEPARERDPQPRG